MLMKQNNTKSPRIPQQRSLCRHACMSTGDILPGWMTALQGPRGKAGEDV